MGYPKDHIGIPSYMPVFYIGNIEEDEQDIVMWLVGKFWLC